MKEESIEFTETSSVLPSELSSVPYEELSETRKRSFDFLQKKANEGTSLVKNAAISFDEAGRIKQNTFWNKIKSFFKSLINN